MANIEGDRVMQLVEAIERSPQAVKEEFDRTANDWMTCFSSRLFVVETHLNSDRAKAHFAPEDYATAHLRLGRLKDKVKQLREQYTGKLNMPPDALQKELFTELDIVEGLL